MNHDNENVQRKQVIPDGNGFILLFSNHFQTLLTLADAYFYLGYSVIPLVGDRDPSRAKVPAVPWAAYQTRRANQTDYQNWFAEKGYEGLGIVTGRISQIVVLDFDSEAVYNAFRLQYPDLLETHTVRSAARMLPHLYFRLPSHLSLASQKGQGVDLLSDGRYVVAPPTSINGQPYKISRGGMPKVLTERDVRRLQSFLNSYKETAPIIASVAPQITLAPNMPPSVDDLHALYRHLAASRGRNEALFHTSLFARDRRLSVEQVKSALVSLHREQKSTNHPRENPRQREAEAIKTIHSAFSRPPRMTPSPSLPHTQGRGILSNSVREALLQRGQTYVVRTIEGLYQSGMKAGQRLTSDHAIKQLHGLVGRNSILKALKAGEGENYYFAPVSPPNTANAIAHSHEKRVSKKCFLIVGKNGQKPQGGRPNKVYRLPGNRQLCRMLGVKVTKSDVLERDDLASAKQTRMGLQRELIKRRPASYNKRWMAARLGMSPRTIYAYNQQIHIHSRPMYFETRIRWKNITRLPLEEPMQGAFLQTIRGKKYPAQRSVASRLLADGEAITLKEQRGNYYWYGDIEPKQAEWVTPAKQPEVETIAVPAVVERTVAPIVAVQVSSVIATVKPKPKKVSKNGGDYKKPLKNETHEALARQLYTTLNGMGGVDFRKLSQASARWLASSYDEKVLRAALDTLGQRRAGQAIRNPVGFFITLVRSEGHPLP